MYRAEARTPQERMDEVASALLRPYRAEDSRLDAFPGFRPPRRTSSWAILLSSLREGIVIASGALNRALHVQVVNKARTLQGIDLFRAFLPPSVQ